MKPKNLVLLVGPPASGKSTFVNNMLKSIGGAIVSRDDIRFSKLQEGDSYFQYENEVFTDFIATIKRYTKNENIHNIFVDATHLTEKARNTVLDKLKLENYIIRAVNFKTPLCTCLEQNEKRKGIGRTYVSRSVIKRMWYQFKPATYNEKYKYVDIVDIGGEMKDV